MRNLIQPKGVLEIADSAAYILRRNLAPLMLLGLYSQIPVALLDLFLNPVTFLESAGSDPWKMVGAFGLFYLVLMAIAALWAPAMTLALYHVNHSYVIGEPVSAGRSLDFAFRNYGRAVWTYFLYLLIVGGAGWVAYIGLIIVLALGIALGTAGVVLGLVVGGSVLLVGVLFLVIGFLMTMPVLAVEGISGAAALKRAWDLAYHYHEPQFESKTWVRFLLLAIIYALIVVSFYGIGALPAILINYSWTKAHAGDIVAPLFLRAIGELLSLGTQIFVSIFHGLLFYLLYLDVRVRYEAFDLQLAVQAPAEGPPAPPPEAI